MKVLLLGATSFVGRNIAEELFNRGHRCILHESSICNLLDYNRTKEYIDHMNCEVVIVCAALSGGITWNQQNKDKIFFDNTLITLNTLKSCAIAKSVKRIISLVSSCSYPDLEGDLHEHQFFLGLPNKSVREFGMYKRNIVAYSMALKSQYPQKDFVCPILNNMYGPGDSLDLQKTKAVNGIIRRIYEAHLDHLESVTLLGTGNVWREFLYVKDGSKAICDIMEMYDMPNDPQPEDFIINISTEEETSIKELAEMVKEIIGYKGQIIWSGGMDGQIHKRMNTDKIEQLLGFKAETPLRIGLSCTIKYFKENYQHGQT